MSKVSITREKLDELALQVSAKTGEDMPLTIDDMTDAVAGIPYPPSLQSKRVSPTETEQTVTADSEFDALSSVDVGAISSTYVGSGIPWRWSSDVTVSGKTVTIPKGFYVIAASKSVASGTAGTPIATKGTVSNHAVSVTPSVTNTTGYITGGTKTGTAVTVSASELVSGTKSITENGTGIDVTEYAAVNVNVSDSTFVVTLSYNEQTEMWEPDCTYAEIAAAAQDGKMITANGNADGDVVADGGWYNDDGVWVFGYATYEFLYNPERMTQTLYELSPNGLRVADVVTISVPTLQSKSATPTESAQTISADSGYDGLSQVTVNPIPTNYGLITYNGSSLMVS